MGHLCTTIQNKIKNTEEININECINFNFMNFLKIQKIHTNKKMYKVLEITDDLTITVAVNINDIYYIINLLFNNIVFPLNTVNDEDEIQASLKAQDILDQKILQKYINFDIISYNKERNGINANIYLNQECINIWTIQTNIGISKSKIRNSRPNSWLHYQNMKMVNT